MYRVLVCCFNPRSVNNIHYGFIDAGCNVKNLNIGFEYMNNQELLKQHLFQAIDELRPDFVFSYGWWKMFVNIDDYISMIKQKGLFHIYWAYDDPDCFEEISLPMASKSDLVFTTVEECIQDYKSRGVHAFLLPLGCYPPLHKRVEPKREFMHDITLLAHNYNIHDNPSYFAYRLKGIYNVLKPLIDKNYDVKVWGLWWTDWNRKYIIPGKNYGGNLPSGNEAAVHSSSKIVLGLQTVGTSKTHFSVRTFEAMSCGAFHLSQYSPALPNYFTKGVHMEWSNSPEETLEIVSYYLKNDDARERVALQGQQEVWEKHTIVQRARSVMETVRQFR